MSPSRPGAQRRPLPDLAATGPRHAREAGAEPTFVVPSRHLPPSPVAEPLTGAVPQVPVSERSSGLLRSSAVMAAGTLVSRLLGFVRVWLLTVVIGQNTGSANAFQIANNLPNLLFMLIMGGMLNAVLVPQIVRATKQPDGGREYVNRLVTWCLVIIVAATVATTAATPWLVPLQSLRNRAPEFLSLTIAMAFWCVPQILFYGLYAVFGQYLNARGRFGAYMWSPVAANVIQLLGLVLFLVLYGPSGSPDRHPLGSWTPQMVAVLAGSSTLGIAVQALVLLPLLRRAGFRYRPTFGLRGVGLRSAGQVAGWTVLTTVITNLAILVTNTAANTNTGDSRGIAGVAAISNGLLLMMLPHSLIGVSLATALFTTLSDDAREGRWDKIRKAVSSGLRNVGVFNVMATAGLVALALPIAAVFTSSTVEAEGFAHVIVARGSGLVFYTAFFLLQRVCYAYEDARTPFLTQIPECILMGLASLAALAIPVQWVAVFISGAWSVGSLLTLVLTVRAVERRHGSLRLGPVVASHLRMIAAAVVAGVVAGRAGTWLLHHVGGPLRLNGLVATAVGGLVLMAVYLLLLRVLRAPELATATGMVRRRLDR